jgi:hypothetical protein
LFYFYPKALQNQLARLFSALNVFIFKENGSFDYKGLKMADLNKDGIIDVRDVTELQKKFQNKNILIA